MSTTTPSSIEAPNTNPATQNPDRKIIYRCRSLTSKGDQCKQAALRGSGLLRPALRAHRRRLLPSRQVPHPPPRGRIRRPAHPHQNGPVRPSTKRSPNPSPARLCTPAASPLPPSRAPPRQKASDQPEPIPEAAVDVSIDYGGNLIGPREEYRGPTGVFEPQWSWSKYMYEKECEQLGLPTPTCAADFPKSGWLTEDEVKTDPARLVQGYHARVRAEKDRLFFIRKEESAAALAAGLPDPHEHLKADNPDCPSRTKVCGGPLAFSACPDCRAKRTPGMGFDDLDNEVFNDPIADEPPLDLKAAADSSSERCTLNAERLPIRCPLSANRSSELCALSSEPCRPELCALSSDLCKVVESVNTPTPLIPKPQKFVSRGVPPSRRPQCASRRTQPPAPQTLPLPLLRPASHPLLRLRIHQPCPGAKESSSAESPLQGKTGVPSTFRCALSPEPYPPL
jgi:hypothetical protein